MAGQPKDSVLSWYVVHTNPRQEQRAECNLRAWRVETFAPRVREARLNQFTGAHTFVIKPLFAGYAYLENFLHKARFTRGIHSPVAFAAARF